jgi:hypothetical protein
LHQQLSTGYIEFTYDGKYLRAIEWDNGNATIIFEEEAYSGDAYTSYSEKDKGLGPAPHGVYWIVGDASDFESGGGFGDFSYAVVGVGSTYQRYKRTGIRIHEEANVPGTHGCIGLELDASNFPSFADSKGIPDVDSGSYNRGSVDDFGHENEMVSTDDAYNSNPYYLFVEYPEDPFYSGEYPWPERF